MVTDTLPAGLTFELAGSSAGPSTATDVTFTDTLPAGLAFDAGASDHRCAALGKTGGSQLRCVSPSLAPGDSTTFTVVARVGPALGTGSVLTNDAQAAAVQSAPNAVAAARVRVSVVRQVDLAVTQQASAKTVAPGEPFSFTIRVVNRGPSAASDVIVADRASTPLLSGRLRPGTGPACSPGGVPFQCTVSQLMPGASVTLVVDAAS